MVGFCFFYLLCYSVPLFLPVLVLSREVNTLFMALKEFSKRKGGERGGKSRNRDTN